MAIADNGGYHPDLEAAGFIRSGNGGNWYRPGHLLTLAGDAGKVEYVLEREVLPGTRIDKTPVSAGLYQFAWTADRDPGEIVDEVRTKIADTWSGYEAKVSPNHLFGTNLDPMTGQPFDAGGPAGFPRLPRQDEPDELTPRAFGRRTQDEVVVGVVDTGIASVTSMGLRAQDWLEGSFLASPADIDHLAHEKQPLGHQAGHGTAVTGVVLQHAPHATVRVARALQANGVGDGLEIADAIERLGRAGIHILNLSLGCYTRKNKSSMAVEEALRRLDSDVVVVAAAGNLKLGEEGEGTGEPDDETVASPRKFWPAALPWVISVGALEMSGGSMSLAKFSNHGGWVTAYAKGKDVFSTFLSVDDTRDPDTPKTFKGYCYWSGTSFAAPAVAGAIAARMQQDRLTARGAVERLLEESGGYTLLPGKKKPVLGKVLNLVPQVEARRRR